jgi:hypothetical protein
MFSSFEGRKGEGEMLVEYNRQGETRLSLAKEAGRSRGPLLLLPRDGAATGVLWSFGRKGGLAALSNSLTSFWNTLGFLKKYSRRF